ncbi:hypothetical protein [Humisphaera borealis]|uniref:Uncharacterized protein n=1 Tax=Humisphaera borealis TaxID=2807512 RepID=A0A7M2X289_9BACT|nr:hypothetical protein [Humisphaera borealis]QOV91877.1 hypothetical protein IPV69_11200 [Humisphaera borealis]
MNRNFGIPDDTIVVTSTYVTTDGLPVLEVSHEDDEEGGSLWQFHCGNGDYDMAKMQLVRLDTILRIDPSVAGAAQLPLGKVARRTSKEADWELTE